MDSNYVPTSHDDYTDRPGRLLYVPSSEQPRHGSPAWYGHKKSFRAGQGESLIDSCSATADLVQNPSPRTSFEEPHLRKIKRSACKLLHNTVYDHPTKTAARTKLNRILKTNEVVEILEGVVDDADATWIDTPSVDFGDFDFGVSFVSTVAGRYTSVVC